MSLISETEYHRLKKAWLKEQLEKANPKPTGMFANWGWHLRKEREFKKLLAEQGIEVDWYIGSNI